MKKVTKRDTKGKTASLNSSLQPSSLDQSDIKNGSSSNNISSNNTSNNNINNSINNGSGNFNNSNNVHNQSNCSKRQQRWISLRQFFQNFHQQRFTNRGKKPSKQTIENYSKNSKQTKRVKDKQPTTTAQVHQTTSTTTSSSPVLTEFQKQLSRENLKECPICTLVQTKDNFPPMSTTLCSHQSCIDCMKQYLRIEITESRVNVACPECPEQIHPNDIRSILIEDPNLYSKYEEFMLRRVLTSDPDARWCPAPNCNFVVIASGCASCPKIQCLRRGCWSTFCYHCKQHWHPNQTCDAAKAERSSSSSNFKPFSSGNDGGALSDMKACPRCEAYIIKMADGSCNHMVCTICGAEFCWLCMKEISDLHYLSPSGCTFWGKKPWSQKKKVLWQLGTLVGAPVGIVLIAGIAVPTIIIGVPVWVARRIFTKCSYMTAHKRNLSIAGGIISSTLISPLLAAIAVGIGVPILLAYVYGVVPISLCRSGGCGSNNGGGGGGGSVGGGSENGDVVVEMEEKKSSSGNADASVKATPADARSVVEGSTHGGVTNPSIGPSIGEMSLAMTNSLSASGSHLERVWVIREDGGDRDSASHRAMAGSCVVESLSGSLLGGVSAFHNRLEVQAEMAVPPNHPRTTATATTNDKRSSFSSDSNNLSLDNKSVSFGDNVSVVVIDNNNKQGNNNNININNNNNNNSNYNSSKNNFFNNYHNNSYIHINNNNNNNNIGNNSSGGINNHNNINNNNNNYNNINNNYNKNVVGDSLPANFTNLLSDSNSSIDHCKPPSVHIGHTNSAYNNHTQHHTQKHQQQLHNIADHNNNKSSRNNNNKSKLTTHYSNSTLYPSNNNILPNSNINSFPNNSNNYNTSQHHSINKYDENYKNPDNNTSTTTSTTTTTTSSSMLRSSFHRYGSPPTARSVSFKTVEHSPIQPKNSLPHYNKKNHDINFGNSSSSSCSSSSGSGSCGSGSCGSGSSSSGNSNRGKGKSKKQSMSVGDSIDEESSNDHQTSSFNCSSHSLASSKATYQMLKQPLVSCFPGGSDIVSMVMAVVADQTPSRLDDQHCYERQGGSGGGCMKQSTSYSTVATTSNGELQRCTSNFFASQSNVENGGSGGDGESDDVASCSNVKLNITDVGGGDGSYAGASGSSVGGSCLGGSGSSLGGSGLKKLSDFKVDHVENKTTTPKFKFLSSKPLPYFSRLLREEGYNKNKTTNNAAAITAAANNAATITAAANTTADTNSSAVHTASSVSTASPHLIAIKHPSLTNIHEP